MSKRAREPDSVEKLQALISRYETLLERLPGVVICDECSEYFLRDDVNEDGCETCGRELCESCEERCQTGCYECNKPLCTGCAVQCEVPNCEWRGCYDCMAWNQVEEFQCSHNNVCPGHGDPCMLCMCESDSKNARGSDSD